MTIISASEKSLIAWEGATCHLNRNVQIIPGKHPFPGIKFKNNFRACRISAILFRNTLNAPRARSNNFV